MSSTALAPSPAAPGRESLVRRYQLTTTGGSEVLIRVLSLIRRRGGEVLTLEFSCGDQHHPPVLDVAVAIESRLRPALTQRLAGLVEVLEVREVRSS